MTVLLVCAVLASCTLLVAWLAGLEIRRVERRDYQLRALHPSQRRGRIAQPDGEQVRVVAPPYDWQRWEDDCGDT